MLIDFIIKRKVEISKTQITLQHICHMLCENI